MTKEDGTMDHGQNIMLERCRQLFDLTQRPSFQDIIDRIKRQIGAEKQGLMNCESLKDLIKAQTRIRTLQQVLEDIKSPVTAYQHYVKDVPLYEFMPVSFDDDAFTVLFGDEVPDEAQEEKEADE